MVRCVACNTGRATFHSFPKDLGMRQKWLANIRDHLVSDITPEKLELWLLHFPVVTNPGIWRVCSRHFEQRCFSERTMTKMMNTASKNIPNLRLCYDAIPTLFTEQEISRKGHMSHLGPAKAPELRKLKPKEPALEHSGVLSDVIQGVPVNTLVNTAVNMPVNTAVNMPVNTPVNTLVNTAVNMPVNAVNVPVTAAVSMPVNAAVNTLVNTAVTPAVNVPVNTLVNTAVNTPVNTVGLVNTSVNTLVSSPVNSLNTLVNKLGNIPVNTLVNTPVNTPVNTFILTHSLIGQVQPVQQVPVVELSSMSNSNSTEVDKTSPDVPAENLRENLQSQLSRWKGACKALRLTDDQMAKFLLDRYYKGDKSVSACTGSQSTHKTLLLDQGLLTLWNDSMADKGFSSDKDFLWFLLLGPQKSGTDSEGLTVRDHGASDECVTDKVSYVGPGDTASVTYKESNGAVNCPLTLPPTSCNKTNPTQKTSVAETAPVPVTPQNCSQADSEAGKDNGVQKHRRKKRRKTVQEVPPKDHPVSNDTAHSPKKCQPNRTQKKISDETAMTTQVPVTSQNDEMQSRKQVLEPKVFPDSLDKDCSHCDNVVLSDTAPTQQKVGGTENGASAPCTDTQKSLHVQRVRKPCSKPYTPNRAKKRKYFIPEAWREPANDMQGMGDCENSTTCSQPTSNTNSTNRAKRRKYRIPEAWREHAKDMNGLSNCENSTCSQSTSGEVGVDLKDNDELEIDLNDCNSSITSSQLCSSAVSIPVKQEDDPNHSLSSQLSWGGTVRTKVEKEDVQEMNLCSFDNTNLPNRAKRRKYLVPGPREGPSKDTSNCESSTTSYSKYLVPGPMAKSIKDLGSREITTTAPQPSCGEVGNDFMDEDELEIDLNDCDITTASSQISSGTVCIKQEDEVEKNLVKSDNHGMSSQQRWGGAVNIKVEKEDGLEMNLCRFNNANVSCRQYSTNINKGNNVDFDNCDYTSTPQLCHDTVSIKVEREDWLEMGFGCYSTGNTPSEPEPSFDTDDIQDEELEMHLKRAILATAEHLG